MRCRTASVLITRQRHEPISPEAGRALFKHLKRCSACRARGADPEPLDGASQAVADDSWQAGPQANRPRRSLFAPIAAGGAAVLAAGAAIVFAMRPPAAPAGNQPAPSRPAAVSTAGPAEQELMTVPEPPQNPRTAVAGRRQAKAARPTRKQLAAAKKAAAKKKLAAAKKAAAAKKLAAAKKPASLKQVAAGKTGSPSAAKQTAAVGPPKPNSRVAAWSGTTRPSKTKKPAPRQGTPPTSAKTGKPVAPIPK